ncbi:MAG: response regulator [Calditrichaeota bacterium]|nr:MAG: response regulator [Calditrichota bacterium]
MQILIIDDDEDVRKMLCRALQENNFEIFDAPNGVEGLHILEMNPEIDVVITDLIMPEKDGIETISAIKKMYSQTKIIAISGGGKVGAESYLNLAQAMGAGRTLKKPFGIQELLEAVHELGKRI